MLRYCAAFWSETEHTDCHTDGWRLGCRNSWAAVWLSSLCLKKVIITSHYQSSWLTDQLLYTCRNKYLNLWPCIWRSQEDWKIYTVAVLLAAYAPKNTSQYISADCFDPRVQWCKVVIERTLTTKWRDQYKCAFCRSWRSCECTSEQHSAVPFINPMI